MIVNRIRKDRIILAALRLPGSDRQAEAESIAELAALCRTAGGEVVAVVVQNRHQLHPGHLFGEGKIEEMRQLTRQKKSQLIVFDGELTPSQQEKLEQMLDVAVIDRPALILDIFARHARTREAITQVKLAQLEYLYPRLAGHWTHLERQEAAIGTRGPGETQLETDRRLVKRKIAALKRSLSRIDKERDIQRQRRRDKINFCLVGYTNAGKSSLFNRLTAEKVYVADRLFATLDSTTRRLPGGGKIEVLLTDTVGFIRKLPVNLVASFRSTLKEVNSADMLLHVIDATAPDLPRQIAVVNSTLHEIGASGIPRLHIFNKIDLVQEVAYCRALLTQYPGAHLVSALTGEGVDVLRRTLIDTAATLYARVVVKVPASNQRLIAVVLKAIQVSDSRISGDDFVIEGRILKFEIGRLARQGVKFDEIGSAA